MVYEKMNMGNKDSIDLESFEKLSPAEVAGLVREAGPQVCIFPINGTRRWFTFEYGERRWDNPVAAYMDISSQSHISLYRLFFNYGIDTLVTPTLGSEILLRGEEYMGQIGAEGLARLASHKDFLDFYDEMDIRVHFYGDYRKRLQHTSYSYLSDLFDEAAAKTYHHTHYRLLFGVFADDATESISELSVRYFQETGIIADKPSLIERYYGEVIPPATLFIGFGQFWIFDYPLLSNGTEDLYFTIAPSPYLNENLLRGILYDHLYKRPAEEPDYASLPPEEQSWLRNFYRLNSDRAFGIGNLYSGVWIPQVSLRMPKEK
jgi:adenosine tuberculosinyltransferase